MKTLYTFQEYLARKYGKNLYRIPIDLALGCPNRENRFGPGCAYCSENGSRARHLARNLDLAGQVTAGREYLRRRYHSEGPYIAYFQAFTSTYAPVEVLRRLYGAVLRQADFPIVIISTRPDALEEPVCNFIAELAQEREVWVELGVQTANDATLQLIRRGHDFAAVEAAVARLAAHKIPCAAHVIIGLPNEGPEVFFQTAARLASLPFRAVKLHQLMVLKHTKLAEWYNHPESGIQIQCLNEYEYAGYATEFLRRLPEGWLIMRLTGDADEESLIAPKWWMTKGQFLEFFRKSFADNSSSVFPRIETGDGSYTLYHPVYRQHFHSLAGAESAAVYKFLNPSGIVEKLKGNRTLRLLDIGFGLGINAFAAMECAESLQRGRLEVHSLELDHRVLSVASELASGNDCREKWFDELKKSRFCAGKYSTLTLYFGDARSLAVQIDRKFDYIFMDGFSPDVNPELWSYDFVRVLASKLAPEGVIISYCAAQPFRGALLRAGLHIGETPPYGRKKGGTIASFTPFFAELDARSVGIILHSTAGTPYRDRTLSGSAESILRNREKLVHRLRRMGVPKWYKDGGK